MDFVSISKYKKVKTITKQNIKLGNVAEEDQFCYVFSISNWFSNRHKTVIMLASVKDTLYLQIKYMNGTNKT